jgi:transposase InsO family protein
MTKAEQARLVAGRIAAYLKRFHQIALATSSVHRILVHHGMPRLPANQKRQAHGKRWQRYEKPQPGHRLQVDVKFLERIPRTRRRLYQFTAIDDCPRIRVLKVYDACNQRTAKTFLDEILRRLPFRVHVVQTDNGAEFQSEFHWHLERLDIKHVYIRPRTPHLNGKVERSHRVDDQEFYQLLDQAGISDDIHLFNEKLREWEDYYNYHRPHGAQGDGGGIGADASQSAARGARAHTVQDAVDNDPVGLTQRGPSRDGRHVLGHRVATDNPTTPCGTNARVRPIGAPARNAQGRERCSAGRRVLSCAP